MKRFFLSILTALIAGTVSFAFPLEGTIKWNADLVPVSGDEFELVLTGNILDGWHSYPYGDEAGMTGIDFSLPEGAVLVGTPSEEGGFTDYKGEELSMGQWQRIALARQLYSDAPVLVFDEPTAWMDIPSRDKFYKTLDKLKQEKVVILIKHV